MGIERAYNNSMNAVTVDKEIQGGTPCFTGTRVPIVSLFDHLEGGYTIDYFLSQFPSVKREQVLSLLESAKDRLDHDSRLGVK